ncbi:hypothetical protein HPB50_019572 [Hyalomma asiaticum]|uniref:Uncharacterized protein n=1 Tax=Hyalomma asiaticum TaxID=266040 RepID=A0ACB7RJP1_HYAAI|nr:hypothetical protein HPB50_019572 [Hyalomma asiaticum]
MDVRTLFIVVHIAVSLVAVSPACDDDYDGFEGQQPIDPISREPYPPGSVGVGGPCQGSRECRQGLCCVSKSVHGDYTCQRKLGMGRTCKVDSPTKGGKYLHRCPCVDSRE